MVTVVTGVFGLQLAPCQVGSRCFRGVPQLGVTVTDGAAQWTVVEAGELGEATPSRPAPALLGLGVTRDAQLRGEVRHQQEILSLVH